MRGTTYVGLMVLAGGCLGPPMDVREHWYPAASPYGIGSNYAWTTEGIGKIRYSPDYLRLLRVHVDRVLGAKGYVLTDASEADFLVRTVINKREHASETGHEYYDQATVTIDVLQRRGKRLLWRGFLQTRIAYDLPPAKRRKRLRFGVDEILRNFPAPRDSSDDH